MSLVNKKWWKINSYQSLQEWLSFLSTLSWNKFAQLFSAKIANPLKKQVRLIEIMIFILNEDDLPK